MNLFEMTGELGRKARASRKPILWVSGSCNADANFSLRPEPLAESTAMGI